MNLHAAEPHETEERFRCALDLNFRKVFCLLSFFHRQFFFPYVLKSEENINIRSKFQANRKDKPSFIVRRYKSAGEKQFQS